MFSLCIATMDRFDDFLSIYLPKYLKMDIIDEIIITDENGNDVAKIYQAFPNDQKLRLFVNDTRLGPLLNKLRACSFAKSEWIALMDSDNFADIDFFKTARNYMIANNLLDKKNIIISPCFAKPKFNFTHLSGLVYKKGNFEKNNTYEKSITNSKYAPSTTLMNTGNYIINKYLTDNVNLEREQNINMSSSSDVIYFNTLLFEQLDLNFHVVPRMEYEHVFHMGSIYIQSFQYFQQFADEVHKRYKNLK